MHINWTSSEIYDPTHLREKLCPIKSETQHQPRNKLSGGHEKISGMAVLDRNTCLKWFPLLKCIVKISLPYI